jgi:hypothetical protein
MRREAGKQFDPRVLEAFLAPGSHDLQRISNAIGFNERMMAERV